MLTACCHLWLKAGQLPVPVSVLHTKAGQGQQRPGLLAKWHKWIVIVRVSGWCAETFSPTAGVKRWSIPLDGPAAAAEADAVKLPRQPAGAHAQLGPPAGLPAGTPVVQYD